ncbi:chromosome partition protein Smc [mine drainage metagenome]|uniref:Chromosome partition protein Smc n=1 Tax=mine drainage metagenome TaxID=410659 RepID=A0A1J5SKC8_9ZZZZ
MKELRLKKLYLLSMLERAARKIEFDPKVTVIRGTNDTGKSSLIKSIYWCLGAEPAVINPRWKEANVTGLLEFTVDDIDYSILRMGNYFAIFDADGAIIEKTANVTKVLSPVISNILDFKLCLTSRSGESEIPPPAYCFLPFYVDQDHGWQQTWQSFAGLTQYANWRQHVIYYHSGIRPNEYFEANALLTVEKQKRATLEGERKVVDGAYSRIKERRKHAAIDFDPESYRRAINDLLKELAVLQEHRTTASSKLADLTNQRSLLEDQVKIAKSALEDFDKDYKFIRDDFSDNITCPTCGTEHENSFVHRFSLLEDHEACRKFVWGAAAKIDKLSRDIANGSNALGRTDFRLTKINALLQKKRGRIKLKDVIEAEGEKKAYTLMRAEVDRLTSQIEKLSFEIEKLEERLRSITDKKHQEEVEQFYLMEMTRFIDRLNVESLSPSDVESIDCKIKETGSDRPRAILAYVYAYIRTIRKYTTACMCPIVIDSPKQQDLDDKNAEAAFGLIFAEQPAGSQLILGTVSMHDVVHSGSEIVLTEKWHLLQADEFDEVYQYLKPKYDPVT